jgi:protein translocase SecG subunit
MSIYNYTTIVTTGILVFLILIQTRGATLGAGLGSSGEINTQRRGSDLTLHRLTILAAFVFTLSLIIGVITIKN